MYSNFWCPFRPNAVHFDYYGGPKLCIVSCMFELYVFLCILKYFYSLVYFGNFFLQVPYTSNTSVTFFYVLCRIFLFFLIFWKLCKIEPFWHVYFYRAQIIRNTLSSIHNLHEVLTRASQKHLSLKIAYNSVTIKALHSIIDYI